MSIKKASTDYPIHYLLTERWSPYSFEERLIAKVDILSLLEAARWAPSSYNEQPWNYIIATRDDPDEIEQILSCLVESNQAWAKSAPAILLGVVSKKFIRNNKPNKAAEHDLGLATGNLVFEASSRGLYVHQMIGILPDKAREVYQIPEDFEALTAIAIGYRATPNNLPDPLKERDLSSRSRKPLSEFVFSGKWGETSGILHDSSS